jgi:hypothetical protein
LLVYAYVVSKGAIGVPSVWCDPDLPQSAAGSCQARVVHHIHAMRVAGIRLGSSAGMPCGS